jgi:hypothetical protein
MTDPRQIDDHHTVQPTHLLAAEHLAVRLASVHYRSSALHLPLKNGQRGQPMSIQQDREEV